MYGSKEVFRYASARPLLTSFLIQPDLEISQGCALGFVLDFRLRDVRHIFGTDDGELHATSQNSLKLSVQAQDGRSVSCPVIFEDMMNHRRKLGGQHRYIKHCAQIGEKHATGKRYRLRGLGRWISYFKLGRRL